MNGNHHYRVFTRLPLALLLGFAELTAAISPSAWADQPGWIDQRAAPISPEAADAMISQRAIGLASQRSQQVKKLAQTQTASPAAAVITATSSVTAAALIPSAATDYTQLALALENDPRRIYQFVRNNFSYVPYYGALKGPYLTLKEHSGNDFDQAGLLIELLRAAGISANFQYGSMTLPISAANGQDLAHWLGTAPDANIIGSIIASGGIPLTNNGTSITLDRVWVIATINGNSVALDPAVKFGNKQAGINLATAMAYKQTDVLTAAGGLLGTDSIQNLSAAGLNAELNTLTSNLLGSLNQQYPNAKIGDIIGGLSSIADESSSLPTTLPFPGTPSQTAWSSIPAGYIHTARLQHGAIDTTLNIPQIAGRKLSISYVPDATVIAAAPAGATDFGTANPGQVGGVYTWTPGNTNPVAIQVTSTLTGTDAAAFSFVSGSGSQTIPANNGTVQVQVKFSGVGQSAGRKNATLNLNYTYQGNSIGAQTVALTGAVLGLPVAQLYLDDALLTSEITPSGDLTNLTLSVDHPYTGSYADQVAVFPLKRTGAYVLTSGFGGDHNSTLLADRQRYLDQLTLQGYTTTSREVLSESLNVIGQSWLQQTQLDTDLLAAIADNRIIRHHRFGIIGQETGYFVDIKAQYVSSLPQSSSAGSGTFMADGLVSSAMEHGVLEQLQGAAQPALSTVKLFSLNNQNGGKFFLATPGNYAAIQSQLSGYTASDLSALQTAISNNATLILPQMGQVQLNSWKGKGYIDYRVSGNQRTLGMIISGGLMGGYSSYNTLLSTSILQSYYSPLLTPSGSIQTNKAVDPVDLGSGAYLNAANDLSLGGSAARGLSFNRSYNSQQVTSNAASLGNGWNHNYNIRLNQHSDVQTGLGLRTPQDAAALIVAAFVENDLMSPSQPSLQAWSTSALVAQWATDQLQDNSISVQLGDRSLSFRHNPDGSYVSPPGMTTQLVKTGTGLFQLKERFGTVLAFDSGNRIQSLADSDGNALSFSYSGDLLTQVTDAYNRSLSFTYSSGKLSSVADNQGRSVGYSYTGNDLTGVSDLENKLWQYGYDGNHQILTVINPVNVAIVNNVYDGHGRVIQQTAPRKTGTVQYKMHYTGRSAAEEDPQGHRSTYYYDNSGRTVAVENALGQKAKIGYDGQGHISQQTDANGHSVSFSYDGKHNLLSATNALNQATQMSYDSSLRLSQITDALTHSSKIDYDSKHHPIIVHNALDQQTQSAYAANGLVSSRTDAKAVITTLSYDVNGFPAGAKTGNHPATATQYDGIGRLTKLTDPVGAITQFNYDKRGLLTLRTDPLGKISSAGYDAAGRLISQTDRNGQAINMTYTGSGKPDTISYANNSSVSFSYDSRDWLTGMTDPTGTTSNSYDAAGRLTSHTDSNGFQVQYQYDATGNLTALIYPGNKTVNYSYDALNRLSSITAGWLNKTETYSYDAAGRLSQATRFNGSQTGYGYDNANRLTSLSHTGNNQPLAGYVYTLDANGNRSKAVVSEPQLPEQLINTNQNYSYNASKNRLTGTSINTSNTPLTYDDEGQTKTQGATGYSFDYAHRLSSQGNQSYVYDGVGNRSKATRNGVITKYIYDAAGHTVALSNQNQQTVNSYAYDPYGKLMAQKWQYLKRSPVFFSKQRKDAPIM